MDDVQYHRTCLLNKPLYWPQVEAIKLLEKHIAEQSGDILCFLAARQTMKNECSGEVQKRCMIKYANKGGIYVRTAPTYKPQVVVSKKRLESTLNADPLTKGQWTRSEGYIYSLKNAEVHFLSSGEKASVVGSTASICLDCDEAHKIDAEKFGEDLDPMRAFNAVPCVLWGVAADGTDLLHEHLEQNRESAPDNNLLYPAPIWCELRPQYAKHFNKVINRYGIKHPIVQTQYMLNPSGSADRYLDNAQIHSIQSGTHSMLHKPRDGSHYYVAAIDIAGEEIFDVAQLISAKHAIRDSTFIIIAEVDTSEIYHGYPMIRIVKLYWWTGRPLPEQQDEMAKILNLWRPSTTVIDARAIGEQIATYLNTRFPTAGIQKYKATSKEVNKDCNELYAWVNNGRIQVFRNNDTPEYAAFIQHLINGKKEVYQHDQMRVIKRSPSAHIDGLKALQYITRAVKKYARFVA